MVLVLNQLLVMSDMFMIVRTTLDIVNKKQLIKITMTHHTVVTKVQRHKVLGEQLEDINFYLDLG
jgi:hypothetical protein